jgi:DNA-binding NarL/FixJ family response regulator
VHGSAPERRDEPRREDELPVGVLVVDDQELFRKALRDLVSATPELALVGEAESGEAALAAVEALSPRMVIMDKRMPGMGGIEATRLITERHPGLVVLLVSIEAPNAELMDSCGAAAFLRKQQLSPRALTEMWNTQRQPG